MDNKTVQYKRTFRGSVGAGVSALFNGDGRRYYILEHKDASKYHRAGESQKIIVDEIELGRDSHCQVRFDESYPTVSRRHAAIVKDGNRWKLVQLSKTNSTFLNGHPVETEWYLENGDEIQLSTDGPHLGFIVPEGKQSLVSSIKMTERLELFRKQALRPYKTAIVTLCLLLVLISCAGGYVIRNQGTLINEQGHSIAVLQTNNGALEKKFKEAEDKRIHDSIEFAKQLEAEKKKKKTVIVRPNDDKLAKELETVKNSVYVVNTKIICTQGDNVFETRSTGTGFLLDDGRFITARHCVEPWFFFKTSYLQQAYALSLYYNDVTIRAEIFAINKNGEHFNFKDTDFKIDRTCDTSINVLCELTGKEYKGVYAFGNKAAFGNDWAYCRVSQKGSIKNGAGFSDNLKSGTTVHVLGFPKSLGIGDGSNIIDPIYNVLSVARDGLNDTRCIMVNQGVDHGNSGGPVFVMKNGSLYAVGIVSRGDSNSDLYNHLVPLCNLK